MSNRFLLFVALLISCSDKCWSDELVDETTKLESSITELDKILISQPSLFIKATEVGEVEPGFDSGNGTHLSAHYILRYKGDRFQYDVEISGAHGPTYSKVESFDGQQYQLLDHGGGTMVVSAKQFANDVVMSEGHFLFMPFLFLQSDFKTNAYAQLSYSQLTKPANWVNVSTLFAGAQIAKVSLNNQNFIEITNIGTNIDRVSRKPTSFDVYFSPENGYPMKWDKKMSTGEMACSYSVDELAYLQIGSSIRVPYPKVATLKHYQAGKVTDTLRLEINEIQFGTVDDNDLTIDPSSATRIRDLDHKVYIDVPK